MGPAEGRDTVLRRFLKVFLHDLATPLSAVSLHLEGARRRVRKGEDASAALEIAAAELGKAFELFERGRELLLEEPGPAETFSFDRWVEETVAQLGEGIRVEGATGGEVRADPRFLSEALRALLVNAREASPDQPVTVTRERAGERLVARVENPGRLPGDDAEKLFAPRAAGSARVWGMGLSRARLSAAEAGGAVTLRQKGDRVCAILEIPEEFRR